MGEIHVNDFLSRQEENPQDTSTDSPKLTKRAKEGDLRPKNRKDNRGFVVNRGRRRTISHMS